MTAISFVTWIYNKPAILKCLPINLALSHDYSVEFCLLDVGSTDNTYTELEKIAQNNARVKLYREKIKSLHFARLYNRVASYANGHILCFLDGDNVIGPKYLIEALRLTEEEILHAWSGDWADGTYGRIGLHKETFNKLGGFDESLGQCGYQDTDLLERAKGYGYQLKVKNHPSIVGLSIPNTIKDKVQYLDIESYQEINKRNKQKSKQNIKNGKLIANAKSS